MHHNYTIMLGYMVYYSMNDFYLTGYRDGKEEKEISGYFTDCGVCVLPFDIIGIKHHDIKA